MSNCMYCKQPGKHSHDGETQCCGSILCCGGVPMNEREATEPQTGRTSCPECEGSLSMLLFMGVQPEGLVCHGCKKLWPLPSGEAKVVTGPALGTIITGEEE